METAQYASLNLMGVVNICGCVLWVWVVPDSNPKKLETMLCSDAGAAVWACKCAADIGALMLVWAQQLLQLLAVVPAWSDPSSSTRCHDAWPEEQIEAAGAWSWSDIKLHYPALRARH